VVQVDSILDKFRLETQQEDSYRQLAAQVRDRYNKILKEKLDIFQAQEEKGEKYYNDIYKVFESITDLVVFQRNLRYKVYMIPG
jgi:hypothetical protein